VLIVVVQGATLTTGLFHSVARLLQIIGEIMYAVVVSGGKQHRVEEGETLKLEKLNAEVGSSIDFDRILLVTNGDEVKIGEPVVAGAKVSAEVLSHGRGKKVRIIKFKRRKHHMKQAGHRQWYTEVKITGISA
jgi:large subunit ribosomal protein L21